MAYESKDRSMLWDVNPQPQNARTPRRNIIMMRMGQVSQLVRAAKTPYDVWNLFFTNNMIQGLYKCWARQEESKF